MSEKAKDRWQKAGEKIGIGNAVLEAIKLERERKRKAKKAKKYCVKLFKFFLSTSGLLILNIGYMVAGGFIFAHLEKLNEIEACWNAATDYDKAENATLILLMDMAQRMDGVGAFSPEQKQEVVDEFQEYLQSFALSVLDTGHDVTNDCQALADDPLMGDWSFTGSLVFAVTVVTTIGYGHIAPVTRWGRLVCIAYAIIGLPLFMLALANVGEALANLFRLIYSTICCCGCCKKNEEKQMSKEEEEREEEMIQKEAQMWRLDPVTGRPIPPSEGEVIEEEEEEPEEEEEEEEEEELTVPLTITLAVLLSFIFLGTGLFSFFEGYSFTDATYYSFVTVSTIGFGDLVPDTQLTDGSGVIKAISIILYITVGMAALSMCFQLMADEIVAKFKWIGEKLGISKKEDTEESSDDAESTPMNSSNA